MSLRILPVYVSSTWLDLEPERKAVEQAIQRLRETKFVGMEYFGSRDETTRRASLNEIDRAAEGRKKGLGGKEARCGGNCERGRGFAESDENFARGISLL
jgi:hypothetical protein